MNSKGQSTLEFALSLVLLLVFSFFVLQLTLLFGVGNYVHYATFMSARAYESSGPELLDQTQRAREVITTMLKRTGNQSGLDRWPGIVKGLTNTGVPAGVEIGTGSQFRKDDKDF